MSTSKGNSTRKRPQKHQNKTAFKNNLYDTSIKTKFLNSLEVAGVCKRCKDIIEWKIKYKKYKHLNGPRKCVGCEQKSVKYAYHILCEKCSGKDKCAKCCKKITVDGAVEDSSKDDIPNQNKPDIEAILKALPERKRRTLLRCLKKQEEQGKTEELMLRVEDMIANVDKISLDDDYDSSDLDELDSDENSVEN